MAEPRTSSIPVLYTKGTHYEVGYDVVSLYSKFLQMEASKMVALAKWRLEIILLSFKNYPCKMEVFIPLTFLFVKPCKWWISQMAVFWLTVPKSVICKDLMHI